MLIARKLPIFLWEYAIAHTIYLRNRAYHRSLREFGAPVWILLQGQNKPPKLQPRSKQFYYVGCEDGSKSVLYYSPDTRKVLISRNFRFLNLPADERPAEELAIDIPPAVTREGESDDGVQPPRKLRAKARVDYRYLDNPFLYSN
jgi:hypothetical protein